MAADPVHRKGIIMLYYALVFLVIALISGILGFTGIAGAAVGIAKVLFFVFLALCIVSFFFNRRRHSSAAGTPRTENKS